MNVTIGESVGRIGTKAFNGCGNLQNIYSLNPIPPVFDMSITYVMKTDICAYVPKGSLSAYQTAGVWEKFKYVTEFDPAGIEMINADMKKAYNTYYDIQGRRLNVQKPGLNIINGKKVIIRK